MTNKLKSKQKTYFRIFEKFSRVQKNWPRVSASDTVATGYGVLFERISRFADTTFKLRRAL